MTSRLQEPSRLSRVGSRLAGPALARLLILAGMALLLFAVFGRFWAWFAPRGDMPAPNVVERFGPGSAELEPTDWPHLRGPNFDGVSAETGLAQQWPDEGPPVLWIRHVGEGYSGLIRVGDRVFTQTQTAYRQSVLCLDAESGETIWEHPYDWPYEQGGMYPGPRATPTWHAGRVYFAGPRGTVGCLVAADGRLLWRVNVVQEFGARGIGFGYSCTPLVCDGTVILPVGGEKAAVVALDADDGSTVWTGGDETASYCGALPITLQDRPLVVAFLQNALLLLDRTTGETLWRHKLSREYDEHSAWPVYDEPRLMIASPFRKGAAQFTLEAAGGADERRLVGRPAWDSMQMSNDVASCVLYDGRVYGFDLRDIQTKARRASRGTFRALDFKTGDVLWSDERPGHASLIAADGKLLMLNDRGEAVLANASAEVYEELSRANVFGGEICWTAPTLSRGRLYLRSPTRAACLYVGKPEQLPEARRAAARRTSEIAQPARWDLSWLVGGERPFPFDPPDAAELGRSYVYCILGLLAAAVVASWVYLETAFDRPRVGRLAARWLFWGLLVLLGAVGTPLFNRVSREFIFTWPVILFVAHQLTLAAVVWKSRAADHRRGWTVVIVAVLVFFATCLLYFDLCRRLDLAVQWVFLLGFIPSWPVAVPAAHAIARDRPPWTDFVWAWLSFTVYYGSVVGIVALRMVVNG